MDSVVQRSHTRRRLKLRHSNANTKLATSVLPAEIWQYILDEALRPRFWFDHTCKSRELALLSLALLRRRYSHIPGKIDFYQAWFLHRVKTFRLVCRQWNEWTTWASKQWGSVALPRDKGIQLCLKAVILDIDCTSETDLEQYFKIIDYGNITVLHLQGKSFTWDTFSCLEKLAHFPFLRAIHISNEMLHGGAFIVLKNIESFAPQVELLSLFVPYLEQNDMQFTSISLPYLKTLIVKVANQKDWPTGNWELPMISQLSMISDELSIESFPPLSLKYANQLVSLTLSPWPSELETKFWSKFPNLTALSGDIFKIPPKPAAISHGLKHLDNYAWEITTVAQICRRFQEHIGACPIKSIGIPFQGGYNWERVELRQICSLFVLEEYCVKQRVRVIDDQGWRVYSMKRILKMGISRRKGAAVSMRGFIKFSLDVNDAVQASARRYLRL